MGGGDKKKKKRTKSKSKKLSGEHALASRYVNEWILHASYASPPPPSAAAAAAAADEFLPPRPLGFPIVSCSSSTPTPSTATGSSPLRPRREGPSPWAQVKVLALTDHDTMDGIPEAMQAALKFGMRIIPGVEISTLYSSREIPGTGEPVHILAYYGTCGPAPYEELDILLSNIRDGRYLRAKNMLLKLNRLRMPVKWETVVKIAGEGVAPGRLHLARAMVEAGHVENLKQAFSKYLYDGGPAYAMGSEPSAETVVQLISRTGGISALAHPWTLKNPVAVIRALKSTGLNAMEVYRSDGKVAGFSELADTYGLLKLGGSDFHGRGGQDESELGSVGLPTASIYEFLKLARPVWSNAMRDILYNFAEDPSEVNLEKMLKFGVRNKLTGYSSSSCVGRDAVDLCLSSWLATHEDIELENIRLKLASNNLVIR
uniref:3',5'-nucleoside bisphosphate phosphatase n=1 Tax=Ananas comosus var. bracteatus TaxID=296719 RepID=A0A6V7QW40_ANACO